MELDSTTITFFVLGLLAGLVVSAIAVPVLGQRSKAAYRRQLEEYERTIVDLRQERADDRETNRRLRRELVISTPSHMEMTRHELADANEGVLQLEDELARTQADLLERDRSLREARLAIQEIRLQLEGGDTDSASLLAEDVETETSSTLDSVEADLSAEAILVESAEDDVFIDDAPDLGDDDHINDDHINSSTMLVGEGSVGDVATT